MIDRRRFLRGAALASAAALLLRPGLAIEDACFTPPAEDDLGKQDVAFSLNRLFKELAVGNRPQLTNVHRINGYIKEGSDIVFFGQSIEGMPELLFDDLVIAIRSQLGSYRSRGGVSIDPLINADAGPTTEDHFTQQSRRATELLIESFNADREAKDHNFSRYKQACQRVSRY